MRISMMKLRDLVPQENAPEGGAVECPPRGGILVSQIGRRAEILELTAFA